MHPKKNITFETGALSLLFLIMVFVGLTGFYTYQRLNSIVTTISMDSKPDKRMGIMKDILNDLYRSEISVKSYRLTKSESYLTEFYVSAKTINDRIDLLRELTPEKDSLYFVVDSLNYLIENEYEILVDLLKVKDEYRVKVALDKAMQTVDSNIAELEQFEIPVIHDTVQIQEVEEEKTNFLRKVFGTSKKKKKKEEEQRITDSIRIAQVIVPDTLKTKINFNIINTNLAELKEIETNQEKQMNIRELNLIRQEEIIMEQIRNLLKEVEIHQLKILDNKSKKTEILAEEIKKWIGIFTAATLLLILFTAMVTINFIRKNNQYNKALKKAREKAEEQATDKERFLANMSHEIRTPMNAILGLTEQLLHSQLQNSQKEQLVIVKKAGDHLKNIINEILDYSLIQAGKVVLKKSDFCPDEVINDVIQIMEPIAQSKNIRIVHSYDAEKIYVSGDSMRLQQIAINLLSNAINYSAQGEVEILYHYRKIDEKRVQLILLIKDQGIGMSAAFLKKVFVEFERAQVISDKTNPGTGLGLAITKKLVDLQKGTIHFDSIEGKGTTVKVMIPYEIAKELVSTDEQKKPIFTNPIHGLNFLVVDDEEFNRKVITTILKRFGANYREASNGKEAIDLANKEKFDIVLMDIRMPVMNGLEAANEIRKIRPAVIIIALTAASSDIDKEGYKQNGMNGLLQKPFTEKEFISSISKYISPEVNLDELWKMCQQDENFFQEMLATYIKTSVETLKLMKLALEEDNSEKISELAHRLSAPTKHMGATKLADLLKEAENKTKENSIVNMKSVIEIIENEINFVNAYISQFLKLNNSNDKKQ